MLLAPSHALGTSYLAPRFTCFLLPTLLFALEAGPVPRWRGARRALLATVGVLLLAGVELRYLGMAREGAGLRTTLAAAPAGGRLLDLAYDRGSTYSAETPFIHSGMLSMVGRCGLAERSFARAFHQPVRYRPGVVTPLPSLIEYAPYRFRWDQHGGAGYDLLLVRSAGEPYRARIAGSAERLAPLAHEGRWWLYENSDRGERGRSDPAAARSSPGGGPAPPVPSPGAGQPPGRSPLPSGKEDLVVRLFLLSLELPVEAADDLLDDLLHARAEALRLEVVGVVVVFVDLDRDLDLPHRNLPGRAVQPCGTPL